MVDRLAPVVARTAAVIRKSGLWDLALIVVAFVLYYLMRGAVVERAGEATSRAIRLVELERSLGSVLGDPDAGLGDVKRGSGEGA